MSPRSLLATAFGLVVLLLAGTAALVDLRRAANTWDQMGPLPPGSEVPEFRLAMLDGPPLDNAALQGRVTLMTFWATWCGACADQMPSIVELHESLAAQGLRVVGVNVDRAGAQAQMARDYRDAKALPFEIALDSGKTGDLFRVTMIPHVVIFDRTGQMRVVHQGKVRAAVLRSEVEALLAE